MFIRVERVKNNSKNKYLFRKLARDTVGEVYEPGDGAWVYFGYCCYRISTGIKDILAGVACCFPGDRRKISIHTAEDFSDTYYHQIGLLFVTKIYQGMGIGKKLMWNMEYDLMSNCFRPIHLEGAKRALGFYQHLGYELAFEESKHHPDPSVPKTFWNLYQMAKSPLVYYNYEKERNEGLKVEDEPYVEPQNINGFGIV